MIEALFGAQYGGFIAAAYGISLLVLVWLVVRVWFDHRKQSRALAALEKRGFGRASGSDNRRG